MAVEAILRDLKSAKTGEGDTGVAEGTEKLEARLGQVAAQATKLRSAAMERLAREMEPLRVEVAAAVLSRAARRGREGSDHFAAADGDGDGALSRGEFLALAAGSGEAFAPERLRALFEFLDDDGDGRLSRDDLARCLTVLYRVSRPNVDLCQTMGLTQGKLVRRLALNEVLELVEGPVRESNRVVRVRCRSLQDGAAGWAMACGSNGVVFAQQTRVHFQARRETPLTDAFSVEGCATVRQLKEGELVEVLIWERLDKRSGLKRMKARALRDSAIGWATTVGNAGAVHLHIV